VALAALFGGVVGLGGFTVYYASGLSYLSNDPEACANCHVMWEQFDAWNRGSHRVVATCNDCHAPHDSIVSKYATKARNGFKHSYAFTTGDFTEPIRITPRNEEIARAACLYCHGALTNDMNHSNTEEPTDCLQCHSGVGHET
jgi:cytochrome c nitrite reductase small subunit